MQYNLQADLFINDELTEKYTLVTIYLHYDYWDNNICWDNNMLYYDIHV